MNYLKVGKYVTTHGLKGEIKILSDLNNSDKVLKVGNTIYIGEKKQPFIIKTYRSHQKYDMITLETLNSIEDVLPYKGEFIYVNKDAFDGYFFQELMDYDVYNNDLYIGKVIELLKGVKCDYIVVSDKRIIIPFIDNFIISVDNDNKIIKTNYMI